jgi:large subunit ribosomal protein L33
MFIPLEGSFFLQRTFILWQTSSALLVSTQMLRMVLGFTAQREAFTFTQSKRKNNFRKAGGAVMRVKITLACTECKQRNYNTTKNKKNDPDRIEMNKYCRFCRKHTLHKETK